jgi:hypothetical protein
MPSTGLCGIPPAEATVCLVCCAHVFQHHMRRSVSVPAMQALELHRDNNCLILPTPLRLPWGHGPLARIEHQLPEVQLLRYHQTTCGGPRGQTWAAGTVHRTA